MTGSARAAPCEGILQGMSQSRKPLPSMPRPSPAELRKMPAAERDALLAEQAAEAEALYRTDPDLTGFDAFGEEEANGDGRDAEPR